MTREALVFLGIEIGGTKLQLGVGSGESTDLAGWDRYDVDRSRGAAGIREAIAASTRRFQAEHPLAGIGFGFGGPVDGTRGRVIKSHQVDGWDDFDMAGWCRREFGLPVVLGNDCNAAAVAEARFGAGAGRRRVFYVTVGTGIGGGFAVDGHLEGADRPAVSEIGHLRPGPGARTAGHTVESLAAGPAIEAAAREVADPADRADLAARCGGTLADLTARHVSEAAAAGNRSAAGVLDRAMRVLGWAIAQAITLVSADAVVVGGGVSLMGGSAVSRSPAKVCRGVRVSPAGGDLRRGPPGPGRRRCRARRPRPGAGRIHEFMTLAWRANLGEPPGPFPRRCSTSASDVRRPRDRCR